MAAWDAEEKVCLVQALRDLARENASLRDENATEAERFFKASSMRKKANSKGLEKERNEENTQECKQTSLIIVSCKFGERFFMFQVAYAETIVLDQPVVSSKEHQTLPHDNERTARVKALTTTQLPLIP